MSNGVSALMYVLAQKYLKGEHFGLGERFTRLAHHIAAENGVTYREGCGIMYRELREKYGIVLS